MQRLLLLILAVLALTWSAHAINETIWLTDGSNQDSINVRVGQTVEVQVWINTTTTAISGFQCFVHTPAELAESIPYDGTPTGWFVDRHLFEGFPLFADDHDSRFPNDPLPGTQLDWCYQTGINEPRPTFTTYGVACTLRLRFLQPIDNYVLGFDHDNNHFRNTLYWEGQSAVEHPFYRENGLHVNVVGMELGPLPDLYLTSPAPCDSINLTQYLTGLDSVDPDSIWFSWTPQGLNTTCTLDSLRMPGAFWLRACALGPGRQVDVEVTAHALNLSVTDILRIYRGDPPIIDDGMAFDNPFVTWAEDDETWLNFDTWVTDLDDPVENLTWSLVPGSDHVQLDFDNLRNGHFTAGQDWFGWDTLLVRVTDPGGMADTSRLIAHVTPVNDAPQLAMPGLQQVHPGQPLVLDLQAYSSDIDNSMGQLVWSVTGDSSLVVARVNSQARTLTLEVQPDAPLWTYVEFVVRVTDLEGLWDEDHLLLQVASFPPIWTPLGELLIQAGASLQLDLDDFVSDQDNTDGELTLGLEGMSHVQATVNPVSHVATLQAPAAWTGLEDLRAVARDPNDNTATDTLLVVVLQGGNPLVARAPDLVFLPGAVDSLELDPIVWDADTPDEQESWTVTNSGLFNTVLRPASRRVVYTAPLLPGTLDQSWYRATDPQGHWAEDVGSLAVIDPSGRPVIFPLGEIWMRIHAVDSSLVLDNLVYDYNDQPRDLSWQLGAGTLVSGVIRPEDHRLVLQSGYDAGSESLQLTVTDPEQMSDAGLLVVHVTEGNPPVVSAFAPRYIIAGQTDTLRNLSNWAYDPDPDDQISWSFVDPPASTVHAVWQSLEDEALIFTDSLVTGLTQVGAVATDQSRNSDMEWIQLHMLENQPPSLELGLLANPGEPRLLDLVVLSSEPLRSLAATRDGDGANLAFSEMIVSNPAVRLFRADLNAPEGRETWRIQARDLPGYPQVAGNLTLDSLVIGSSVLARPGDRLPSPDGSLELGWLSGLSNGRWVLREEGAGAGRRWHLLGPAGGKVRVRGLDVELEQLNAGGWQAVTDAGPWSEATGGAVLRPVSGAEGSPLPGAFALLPAVPNPFNPATTLRLVLESPGPASLEIMDLLGRRVRLLESGDWPAGLRLVRWDGRDDGGVSVSSGVYFARLRQGPRQAAQKLILLK